MSFKQELQALVRRRKRFFEKNNALRRDLRRDWWFETLEERRMLASAVLSGGNLQVSDANGVNNALTISSDGTTITLSDPSAPLAAGTGLTQVNANTATLSATALTGALNVDLGVGADAFTFAASSALVAAGGIRVDAESITVGAGAVLSTRAATGDPVTGNSTGNSGNLELNGEHISVATGAKLLAHVQTGSPRSPGSISLTAEVDKVLRLTSSPPAASIAIAGALIKGGAVDITATAQDRFGVLGFKKDATANVTIADTTIDAASLALDATADTSVLAAPPDIRTTGAFTFQANPNQLDTITVRVRQLGVADGFLPGQSMAVQGTTGNDGSYVIATVTATTITLQDGYELSPETAPNATVTGDAVMPDPETILNLLFPFTDSALFTLSNAQANVAVTGGSLITTTGNVAITATGESSASPFFAGLGTPLLAQLAGVGKKFQVSAVWAQSDAKANASVEGTTHITAGGNVRLDANTINTVTANAMASATNTPVDLTFAGGAEQRRHGCVPGGGDGRHGWQRRCARDDNHRYSTRRVRHQHRRQRGRTRGRL